MYYWRTERVCCAFFTFARPGSQIYSLFFFIRAETFHDEDLLELVHLVITPSTAWPRLRAAIKADCLVSRADVLENAVEDLQLRSSAATLLRLTALEAERKQEVGRGCKRR